jgi:hypothetical protein
MFVTGEAKDKVSNGKLTLPKEYHLKKKDILGKWKGTGMLYLSDSAKSLQFITGDTSPAFIIHVDSEYRIDLPSIYEDFIVRIIGCITTIELTFTKF